MSKLFPVYTKEANAPIWCGNILLFMYLNADSSREKIVRSMNFYPQYISWGCVTFLPLRIDTVLNIEDATSRQECKIILLRIYTSIMQNKLDCDFI